jgi:hypothetical protein
LGQAGLRPGRVAPAVTMDSDMIYDVEDLPSWVYDSEVDNMTIRILVGKFIQSVI